MWMMVWIVVVGIGSFFLFNWLMGYRKGHIQIDFNERYMDHKAYVQAIEAELDRKGYQANYEGDFTFRINGKPYVFIERNVPMGGVPLQRTILKPVKK